MKKIVYGMLISTLFFVVGCKASNDDAFAQKIIQRAKEISVLIPDAKSRTNIQIGLDSILVMHAAGEKAEIPYRNHFVLLITEENHMLAKDTSNTRLFRFEHEQMEKTGHVVILMNDHLATYSQNIDILACLLIHEFIHALQANQRILAGKKTDDVPLIEDEMAAWQSHTWLFLQIHPEMKEVTYDCVTGEFVVKTSEEETLLYDPSIRNTMQFYFCGKTFLKTIYDKEE